MSVSIPCVVTVTPLFMGTAAPARRMEASSSRDWRGHGLCGKGLLHRVGCRQFASVSVRVSCVRTSGALAWSSRLWEAVRGHSTCLPPYQASQMASLTHRSEYNQPRVDAGLAEFTSPPIGRVEMAPHGLRSSVEGRVARPALDVAQSVPRRVPCSGGEAFASRGRLSFSCLARCRHRAKNQGASTR